MRKCVLCGSYRDIQMHHVFGGPRRKLSTKYGMVVPLCMACHTGPRGVHQNSLLNLVLKRLTQAEFEKTHSREEFRRIFGKSYLIEDNDESEN